jgi:lipopolysaccharide transport system permease protein
MKEVDSLFILHNLILRDFKVRYRNMSLGMFWSLINPLIMMGVLVFVFTLVFPNRSTKAFPVFLLCGLVPFNFFSVAWSGGMVCIVENAGLVKRVPLPRMLLPTANVLSNCVHMIIQIILLLTFTLCFGFGVNRYWLLLPLVWFFEVVFVLGIVMASCALDVYVRDLRYLVDSINRVMFWLVPIFYSAESVPERYRGFYDLNPVTSLTVALRQILMEGSPPSAEIMWKLCVMSIGVFIAGGIIFDRLERRFYNFV